MEALTGYSSDSEPTHATNQDPEPPAEAAAPESVINSVPPSISTNAFKFPAPPDDFDENDSLVFTTVAKKQRIESSIPATRVPSFQPPAIGPVQDQKGRYVSKREKQQAALYPELFNLINFNSEAMKRLSEFDQQNATLTSIPKSLQSIATGEVKSPSGLPRGQCTIRWKEHTAGVNCIRWSPHYGHLLASASNDHTIKLWDLFRTKSCLVTLATHAEAVKEVQWSVDGKFLLSASYDKTVKVFDLETSQCIQTFKHKYYITALQVHPREASLFLAGGAAAGVVCWDLRTETVVKEYKQFMTGMVQSMEFLDKGREFVTCADVVKRNSLDKAVLVWDFDTGAIMSNQVYTEAFTCTAARAHPKSRHFALQSNGNYIAKFSSSSPYKMNKYQKFDGGHLVSGYHINCNFNREGDILASGSADGNVFLYDWESTKRLKSFRAHSSQCLDVQFHPQVQSMLATCSWNNEVAIWE